MHAGFPLVGLAECEAEDGPLGRILLREGDVPEEPAESAASLRFVQVTPTAVLMTIPQAGRILVRSGFEIIVAPFAGSSLSLQPFILGAAMGAICLQLGLAPLHASAVCNGHGAIAFSGPSGVGKSTMAMAMADHGYDAMTDDLALIERRGAHAPSIFPGSPLIRLWPNSTDALGLDRQSGTIELSGVQKLLFSRGVGGFEERALSAIYFPASDESGEIAIEPMSTAEATAAYGRELYRGQWAVPMGNMGARLATMAHIVQGVPCFRLRRPRDYAALPATAKTVAQHHAALDATTIPEVLS